MTSSLEIEEVEVCAGSPVLQEHHDPSTHSLGSPFR